MDKLLYVGYFTEDVIFEEVTKAGLSPSVARQKFESAFIEELLRNQQNSSESIEIISCVPYNEHINVRPDCGEFNAKRIKYIWWKKNIFSFLNGFLNVHRQVNDWYKRTQEDSRVILTYATNPIMMPLLFRRKTKVITICSEVPRFRVMKAGLLSKIKKEYYHFLNERMDGYIYFSKQMEEVCNYHKKPVIVVEGMPKINAEKNLIEANTKKIEQIFYAGGMNVENGIMELMEAFVGLNRNDVTLVLCGNGNISDKVKKYSDKYENIKYLGMLPNEQILRMEKESTILINPRKVDELLTRYSFPSKTFEYFCSGTACMMTRLAGIPEEYYGYCYVCDSSSAGTLQKDLEKVLNISQEERKQKAREAYEFILREKTAEKQTEKIINFLHSMCSVYKG